MRRVMIIIFFFLFIFKTSFISAQLIEIQSQQSIQIKENQTIKKSSTPKVILPDLVIENIELDNQNRIVFKVKNKAMGMPDSSSHASSLIRVTYGQKYKDYPLNVVDPKRALFVANRTITFTTDITIEETLNVKVEVDVNQKIKEENESNNWLSAVLTPRFDFLPTQPLQFPATKGQAIPKEGMHKAEPPRRIPQVIRVISPNGGETFKIGEKHNIRWEFSGPHTNLKVVLKNSNRSIHLYTCYSTTNTFEWTILKNIPVGSYKVEVATEDGVFKDESDGWIKIELPEVDLSLTVETERIWGEGFRIKLRIINNGTKTLNNVLFNWVVIKIYDNSFLRQDSAGFAVMYPNIYYNYQLPYLVNYGEKIRIYIDPDNLQQESQALRYDNYQEIIIKYKESIYLDSKNT